MDTRLHDAQFHDFCTTHDVHKNFSTFLGPAVNPYVTGSSPVARANFPQISAVFLYFCCGNLFRYKGPKNVKKRSFLHIFENKITYFHTESLCFSGPKTIFQVFSIHYTRLTHGLHEGVSVDCCFLPTKNRL